MDAFGPYYSDASGYDAMRRRRRWSANQLQGYAQYLASGGQQLPAEIIAAETAAFDSSTGSLLDHPILRPVMIGVLTGACTFIVNRWLGKVFK